jgi:DNA-directed RNA polymerase subunit RPC12/RpoP
MRRLDITMPTVNYVVCPDCAVKNLPGRAYCLGCGKPLADLQPPEPVSAEKPKAEAPEIHCLRCGTTLEPTGARHFHEGMSWGALGEIGELFVKKQSLDMHVCTHCGHVEFFLHGIGEEHRGGDRQSAGGRLAGEES